MSRRVAHLDADAFFATCHELADPALRGKAVIVGGSGPRSIVTTASYAARKYGVGSAMPMSRARALCPHATVISPDMAMYRRISGEVWQIVRELAFAAGAVTQDDEETIAWVEQAGIDEAYIDFTLVPRADVLPTLRRIIERVRDQTGIQLSVGLAPTRLIAKIASDLDKPAGFSVISREQALARLADRSLRAVPGIGPRSAERLKEMGCETFAQLGKVSQDELIAAFGDNRGHWLAAVADLTADGQIVAVRPRKSVSSENTFDFDVEYDPDPEAAPSVQLTEEIVRLALATAADVRKRGFRGRNVAIKIRTAGWDTFTRALTLPEYTDDPQVIQAAAVRLWQQHRPSEPVRLLGVRVAAFEHVAQADDDGQPVQLKLPFPEGEFDMPTRSETMYDVDIPKASTRHFTR